MSRLTLFPPFKPKKRGDPYRLLDVAKTLEHVQPTRSIAGVCLKPEPPKFQNIAGVR
jgi:hypothetical protein